MRKLPPTKMVAGKLTSASLVSDREISTRHLATSSGLKVFLNLRMEVGQIGLTGRT